MFPPLFLRHLCLLSLHQSHHFSLVSSPTYPLLQLPCAVYTTELIMLLPHKEAVNGSSLA